MLPQRGGGTTEDPVERLVLRLLHPPRLRRIEVARRRARADEERAVHEHHGRHHGHRDGGAHARPGRKKGPERDQHDVREQDDQRRQERQHITRLAEMDEQAHEHGGQRPRHEEPLSCADAVAPRVPRQQEDREDQRAERDDHGLQQVARHAQRDLGGAADDRRRLHHGLREVERGFHVAGEAPRDPDHRKEPDERGRHDHREPDQGRPEPTNAERGGAEPERKQQDERGLPQTAGEAQIPRGQPRVGLAAAQRAEREVGDHRRHERLASVREPDGAVEPEERAHGEQHPGGKRGPAVVHGACEVIDDERRQAAEGHGEHDVRGGRIAEPVVHEPAERDVEDVPRGVWLVFDDVVLVQRERELDGVPVVQHAGPVRQP